MPLPEVKIPREIVRVGDDDISVRGLTRAEAVRIQALAPDVEAMEILMLACGTDTSEDDVRAWVNATPAGTVEPLSDAIVRLSGLGPDAQFRGGTGPGPG